MQNREKRLHLNTFSSLLYQLCSIVCGFILPRMIIGRFGSEVNGLVGSITQFLDVVVFMEMGIGAVMQASLYKPLSEHDERSVSEIVSSANRFFSKIAVALLVYSAILLCVYPTLVNHSFDRLYTSILILAISLSTFAQYYFGLVDRLLLTADQRGYIQYAAQTLTLLLNTAACAILIACGASIQAVKICSALIFLLRPILLRLYVRRHYCIDRKAQYTEEPIRQKWNGVAQHISYYVLEKTDVIVLTLLSTLKNVSVYNVYYMVISGLKNLFLSLTYGVQALMGELIAKRETKSLLELFDWTEWLIHTGAVVLFGCAGVLIVPFVQVYTNGVNDANYTVPLFAALLTLAYAVHCLKLPYDLLILAAGHFKQTQGCHIAAALINVGVSVLTVKLWGLVGVAVGTLCAMVFQTLWMVAYDAKNILNLPLRGFIKHLLTDLLTALPACLLTTRIPLLSLTYPAWILQACEVTVLWVVISLAVNILFYKDKTVRLAASVFKTHR